MSAALQCFVIISIQQCEIPHWLGRNKTFFIRVWKPLSSRHVLKTLSGSPKGNTQRAQYLLTVGLGRYKWYQSKTQGDVSTRRPSPERGWTRDGVPTRTLGPKEGWIGGSHIDWKRERVSTRTMGPEREWIMKSHISEIPHQLRRRTKHSL